MADNYLEKQYEDYLKRKAAWEKAHRSGIIHKQESCTNRSTTVAQHNTKK